MARLLRAALLVVIAVPAAAQDRPRVSASIGAGVTLPWHGDFDFTAGAWQASVRAGLGRHLAVEGFFGEWRHSSSRVTTDAIISGPNGVLGRVDRVTQRTEYVRPGLGFNLLAAGSVGRVTVSGGGGPGVLLYRRRSTQTLGGCHGADITCRDTETRFSSGSVSLQAVAGLGIAIASRIAGFGEFHLGIPLADVGSGQSAVLAGVRLTIW